MLTLVIFLSAKILIKIITTYSYISIKTAVDLTYKWYEIRLFLADEFKAYVSNYFYKVFVDYFVETCMYVTCYKITISNNKSYTLNPNWFEKIFSSKSNLEKTIMLVQKIIKINNTIFK